MFSHVIFDVNCLSLECGVCLRMEEMRFGRVCCGTFPCSSHVG